ncbi:hypothetical protein TGRH88_048980 [Toxoplasma gondii]|uniref:Uncharacterized protein n=1 Tax=Toxoplasma gondii TaxID=5811 RepID=A0A7J6JWA5_TOXGO|nr:hypothetical protein TGRH88_048980 [Toxoplasma gondii]
MDKGTSNSTSFPPQVALVSLLVLGQTTPPKSSNPVRFSEKSEHHVDFVGVSRPPPLLTQASTVNLSSFSFLLV